MKKIVAFVFSIILLSSFFTFSSAHPGRTDSDGGHFDHSTGEYHFHNGENSGKNSSTSISSYRTYNSIQSIKKEWERRGAIEGLKQLCIDTAYKNNYNSGFQKAIEEYSENRPFFKLLFDILEDEELFYVSFYNLEDSYEEARNTRYSDYYCYVDYYSSESRTDFNNGYDRAYKYALTSSAPESFLLNDEISEVRRLAYDDGYYKFFEGNLSAYKEERPFKGCLISIENFDLKFMSIMLSIIIVSIIILKKLSKSKPKTRHNFYTKNNTLNSLEQNNEPEPLKIQPRKPSQSQKISALKHPPLTISKMMHEIAEDNVKPYKMCCIGKDISAGTLFFAPTDEDVRSFFESGDNMYHIFKKNQRFYFTEGETIYLYNCQVSTEEFK